MTRRLTLGWLAALAGLALQSPAGAAAPPARPQAAAPPAQVTIANSRRLDFVSTVNGRRYAISVGLPWGPPPPHGYRVIYVLDGYDYFASVVEAVRANLNAPDVVVVGIGYPDDRAFVAGVLARHRPLPPWLRAVPPDEAAFSLERLRDLTLPAGEATLAAESAPGETPPRASEVGGLDGFLQTIEREVKPRVEALVPIDRSDQAIFGHSLGGLAVLRALFVEPRAFRTFIAASPSIWWANRAVLADEPAFAAAVERGAAAPRVLITVGADEETVPTRLALEFGLDPAKLEALAHGERMIGNARDLVRRLQALRGSAPYQVRDLAVFADQGHGTSPWPAIGLAVTFAFPPPG